MLRPVSAAPGTRRIADGCRWVQSIRGVQCRPLHTVVDYYEYDLIRFCALTWNIPVFLGPVICPQKVSEYFLSIKLFKNLRPQFIELEMSLGAAKDSLALMRVKRFRLKGQRLCPRLVRQAKPRISRRFVRSHPGAIGQGWPVPPPPRPQTRAGGSTASPGRKKYVKK